MKRRSRSRRSADRRSGKGALSSRREFALRRRRDRFSRARCRRTAESAERAQRAAVRFPASPPASPISIGCSAACRPPTFIILAGRPGMGKTSLATNMAFQRRASLTSQDITDGVETPRGAPVLFFSLEMAAQQLAAAYSLRADRNRDVADPERQVLGDRVEQVRPRHAEHFEHLPLYIDDTGGISIAQIAARARRLKREKKIGLDHHRLSCSWSRRRAAPKTACRKSRK